MPFPRPALLVLPSACAWAVPTTSTGGLAAAAQRRRGSARPIPKRRASDTPDHRPFEASCRQFLIPRRFPLTTSRTAAPRHRSTVTQTPASVVSDRAMNAALSVFALVSMGCFRGPGTGLCVVSSTSTAAGRAVKHPTAAPHMVRSNPAGDRGRGSAEPVFFFSGPWFKSF